MASVVTQQPKQARRNRGCLWRKNRCGGWPRSVAHGRSARWPLVALRAPAGRYSRAAPAPLHALNGTAVQSGIQPAALVSLAARENQKRRDRIRKLRRKFPRCALIVVEHAVVLPFSYWRSPVSAPVKQPQQDDANGDDITQQYHQNNQWAAFVQWLEELRVRL
jgi:hypothetical protein